MTSNFGYRKSVGTTFLDQTMEFNFDRALFLFFTLQRLDSPGMRLKPEQVASISAVCKGKDMKDVFIWLPTAFVKSVCYEMTPFVAETILFVMDYKLRRVDSESGSCVAPV